MSLLSRISAAYKAFSGAQLVVQPYYKTLSFSMFTQEETAQDLLKHFVHWVYICVTKNSAAMAAVPLRLYVTTGPGEKQYKYLRKGIDTRSVNKRRFKELADNPMTSLRLTKAIELEEVAEHPFLQLWNKVNPFMNGFEMVKFIAHYLLLTGDAYLYNSKDGFGVPGELWVLPSQYMRVVPDKKDFIKGYLCGSNMRDAKALTPDEVIHFKFTNPNDIFRGFSPVQGGMSAVKRKEDMDTYEDSLLQNNARPDFLILAKKKMNELDKQALREQWHQLYGSKAGRGRPAVLDTDAEIKTLGFSPKDMAFVQGQKTTKEEICGAFGVPVSKVVPDAKYANAEVGDREWKADTIRPLLTLISDKLNEDLVPGFDGRLFCAFDNPVPEDRDFALKVQESELEHGVIVINAVRARNGDDPVPWGHVPIMPFNMVPFGSAPAVPATEELSAHLPRVGGVLRSSNKAAFATIKIQRPPMTRIPEMARIMRKIYREMESEVLANLRAGKRVKATPDDVWFAFDGRHWVEEVAARMGKPIKAQLVTGGQYGLDRLGTGLRFDVMNPETQKWLRQYVAHFSRVTTRDLGLEFSHNMLAGIEEGETIFELRKRTEEFFGRMKLHKSETIARTESSRGAHHGMKQGWRQSEVVKGSVWRAQSGACDFCLEMDGKYTDLDKSYFEQGGSMTVGGRVMDFGYEEVEGPPLHPNCSCTETAVLID